ncbi:hypothetical protein RRG08_063386 [Elysia crispata]|uniref:SCP domain-containing protein n=1 Tax=Elysia crispata TaxID=231223 RepID=A0AAE1E9F3_9GAST|nr:hypothetical protein RRG08_063386 [Elysia crispata]
MGCGTSKPSPTVLRDTSEEKAGPSTKPSEENFKQTPDQRSDGKETKSSKKCDSPSLQRKESPKSEESEDSESSSYEEVPLKDFRQRALKHHNKLRALHGCPPLKLSKDLNQYAQKWAENMAKKNKLYHSNATMDNGEKLGENVGMNYNSEGADFKGHEPVQMFYDEIKLYNFKKGSGQPGTGHFTQVVWRETTELGMGKARSADGKSVYACGSYRDPGNVDFIGQPQYWRKNVPPPL